MQVAFYLAGEITQVKESLPWVRCASGNVFFQRPLIFWRVSFLEDTSAVMIFAQLGQNAHIWITIMQPKAVKNQRKLFFMI